VIEAAEEMPSLGFLPYLEGITCCARGGPEYSASRCSLSSLVGSQVLTARVWRERHCFRFHNHVGIRLWPHWPAYGVLTVFGAVPTVPSLWAV
jgi:hypothetical protein